MRIVPAIYRDVLRIDLALSSDKPMRIYALLAPHLGGSGYNNSAEVVVSRDRKILAAQQGPFALALAASDEQQRDVWGRASAGYVGVSDGWQDFARNGAMSWQYPRAGPGNVALLGELPARATLALGFASSYRRGGDARRLRALQPSSALGAPDRRVERVVRARSRSQGPDAGASAGPRARAADFGNGAAHPPGQDLSGHDGGEPQHPVGQYH